MNTVMLVFGIRPKTIKMCLMEKELQKHSIEFKNVVGINGRHNEMLDQVLWIFGVIPDNDFNNMKQGQNFANETVRFFNSPHDIFNEYRPEVVLLHGYILPSTADVQSAFCAQIPVGYVEGGLRIHNLLCPWSEEMDRQFINRVDNYYVSQTPFSEKNIKNKNTLGNIYITGDSVIDIFQMVLEKFKKDDVLRAELDKVLLNASYEVTRLANCKKHIPLAGNRCKDLGDVPTDSRGTQKEALGLNKQVLVMRDSTERLEALASGTFYLVGIDYNRIFCEVSTFLNDEVFYQKISHAVNPI